jgi:hypothetical protein
MRIRSGRTTSVSRRSFGPQPRRARRPGAARRADMAILSRHRPQRRRGRPRLAVRRGPRARLVRPRSGPAGSADDGPGRGAVPARSRPQRSSGGRRALGPSPGHRSTPAPVGVGAYVMVCRRGWRPRPDGLSCLVGRCHRLVCPPGTGRPGAARSPPRAGGHAVELPESGDEPWQHVEDVIDLGLGRRGPEAEAQRALDPMRRQPHRPQDVGGLEAPR